MSAAGASGFYEKVVNDPSFRQTIWNLRTPDKVMQAAQAAGFQFTPQEIRTILDGDKGVAPLSTAQLDALATPPPPTQGSTPSWVGAVGTGVGAVVGAVGLAAACV